MAPRRRREMARFRRGRWNAVSQSEGGYKGWHYAVSKDGRRFLVIRVSEDPTSIAVNWFAGLKR